MRKLNVDSYLAEKGLKNKSPFRGNGTHTALSHLRMLITLSRRAKRKRH